MHSLLLAIALMGMGFSPAQEAEKPMLEGKLIVEDKTISLTHAYAFKHDNAEGLRDNAKEVTIILADREIPPLAVENYFARHELVQKGKLLGISLEVDPAKKEAFKGNLLYPPKRENISLHSFTIFNREEHGFTDLKVEKGWISGTVRMTEPDEIHGFEPDDYPKSYRYEATFRARILTPPPVTATLTGEKARNSPQAKTVIAFQTAGKKGDMAATRRLAAPETLQKWDEMEKKIGKQQYLQMWKESWKQEPPVATFRKQITKVVVRGDRATLITRGKGMTGSIPLTRQNGVWKLSEY